MAGDEGEVKTSGASHWVAPECFVENSRPTYASDIYSLGICIVEALRVVGEKGKPCLPWQGLYDNVVVRHNVKQGKFPSRPTTCSDEQWRLVKRMCTFEPKKRLKISTIVDKLARFASNEPEDNDHLATDACDSFKSVSEVISATKAWLTQCQEDDNQNADTQGSTALYSLYSLMWEELESGHHQIDCKGSTAGLAGFCSLLKDADESTQNLQGMTTNLVSLADKSLRCYALRRRLSKFVDAHFLSRPVCKMQTSKLGVDGMNREATALAEIVSSHKSIVWWTSHTQGLIVVRFLGIFFFCCIKDRNAQLEIPRSAQFPARIGQPKPVAGVELTTKSSLSAFVGGLQSWKNILQR
ncbi:unnamed protein product [Phytophthora lilii]|uniref:Unnamed protein product n=1 Tax=Phytophthora lilii TaxID=2077276 RepID=A0A9W6X002_9STRA|nr:unnamed protein product [Phytophthora lilii]